MPSFIWRMLNKWHIKAVFEKLIANIIRQGVVQKQFPLRCGIKVITLIALIKNNTGNFRRRIRKDKRERHSNRKRGDRMFCLQDGMIFPTYRKAYRPTQNYWNWEKHSGKLLNTKSTCNAKSIPVVKSKIPKKITIKAIPSNSWY